MVEIVKKKRRSPVLTPSAIPCLRHLPTINITQGCALGCTYCYIQGYSQYPGYDRVVLYENIAELVRAELIRKRSRPRRVFFSPSSDAFQFLPEVQEVSFDTMSVSLEAGVEVSFLTKGFITERFMNLFARTPRLVFAQIGITSLDRRLWKVFEPRTCPPQDRIKTMARLADIGVRTTARLDPLIPDLSDTEDNMVPLLEALRDAGISEAAASYLFLRPQFAHKMFHRIHRVECGTGFQPVTHRLEAGATLAGGWRYQRMINGCGGGRVLGIDDRRRRFARIQVWGEDAGIRVTPCHCKNPELGSVGCGIAGLQSSTTPAPSSQGLLDFSARQRSESSGER